MISFNVKLADVVFKVECLLESTREAFKEYITDEQSEKTVRVSEEIWKKTVSEIRQKELNKGITPLKHSRKYIEPLVLHELISRELADFDVLLVHGSAICVDGVVYLFTARSGVGKSTHTALWKERFGDRVYYINDDKPFLKVSDGGVLVYGSPWAGDKCLHTNTCAPLKALIKLERGEQDSIEKISAKQMFAELYTASLKGNTPAQMLKIVELENSILKNVPCYSLKCTKSIEAVDLVYNFINS